MAANKCLLASSLCLVSMYKTQKKFEVKMRQGGPINLQTKEKNICRHIGIRCITKLKHGLTEKNKTKQKNVRVHFKQLFYEGALDMKWYMTNVARSAELVVIISYPASPSRIIVLLKTLRHKTDNLKKKWE